MPLADMVDSERDPILFLGAFLGVGAFVLVLASYPQVPLEVLTLGSLVTLAIAYLSSSFLSRSVADRSVAGGELESTEAERILASRLSEVDPEGLDAISTRDPRVRQAVSDLIELWAQGDDLPDFDVPEAKRLAREEGFDAAIDEILAPPRPDDPDQ